MRKSKTRRRIYLKSNSSKTTWMSSCTTTLACPWIDYRHKCSSTTRRRGTCLFQQVWLHMECLSSILCKACRHIWCTLAEEEEYKEVTNTTSQLITSSSPCLWLQTTFKVKSLAWRKTISCRVKVQREFKRLRRKDNRCSVHKRKRLKPRKRRRTSQKRVSRHKLQARLKVINQLVRRRSHSIIQILRSWLISMVQQSISQCSTQKRTISKN